MKDNLIRILQTIGGCFLIVLFILPSSSAALELNNNRQAAEFSASFSRIPDLQYHGFPVLKLSMHDVHNSDLRRYDAGITLPLQNNYYLGGRFGFGDFEGRSRKQLSYEASYLSDPADSSSLRYYGGFASSSQYHDRFRFRELTFFGGMIKQGGSVDLSAALMMDYALGTFFIEDDDDLALDSWLLSICLSAARGPAALSLKLNKFSVIYSLEWRIEL